MTYRPERRPHPFPQTSDPWLLPVEREACGLSDGWWDRRVGTVAHGHRVCVVQTVEWPDEREEASAA